RRAPWRDRTARRDGRVGRAHRTPSLSTDPLASRAMNRLMARFYDRLLRSSQEAGLAETRRELLREARGDVLEIGAGTGLNLGAYPREGISRLVLTEPNPAMR